MSSAIDYVRYSCGIAGEDVTNYVDELEKRTSADTDLIEQLTARVRELEEENRIERNLRIGVEATFDMLNEEIGRYKAAFEQQKEEIQRWKYSAENPNFESRFDTWQSVAGKYRTEAEELEAEVERLSAAHVKACQANADSQAELAAEQLNNKLLRDALEFLNARIVTMDLGGVVERALSIPASTEALDKYVAEKVKEAMK